MKQKTLSKKSNNIVFDEKNKLSPKKKVTPTRNNNSLKSQINRTRNLLVGSTTLLCVFGLAMVLSASSVDAIITYGSPFSIFLKQLLWMCLSFGILILANRFLTIRLLRNLTIPLVGISLILLVAVLLVGTTTAGSSRWIGFGQISVQPSELMKLALVLFGADLLDRRKDRIDDFKYGVLPFLLVFGFAAIFVLKQPDMGTTMVMACIFFGLLFASGLNLRMFVKIVTLFTLAALFIAYIAPYRRERLLSFLHPFQSANSSGYQLVQSLVALGSGHLAGEGLGAGTVKWGFLPNDHTDFIMSVIGQELGLIGCLAILLLFCVFGMAAFRVSSLAITNYERLVAFGITTWVLSQVFINIGAVTGILPVTGIPLPLVSFGGSSLVTDMVAIGILFMILRRAEVGLVKNGLH